DPLLRRQLLSFVVGGGGFSGTEVVAEVNDFVRRFVKRSPALSQEEVSVFLIHSKGRLLDKELSKSLGEYAGKQLQKRGVEILFNERLVAATPYEACLKSGRILPARTIISTVPSLPNPLIASLPMEKVGGRLLTEPSLFLKEYPQIWALGDCAAVPNAPDGSISPATAQFAIRQAKCLARNMVSRWKNRPLKAFEFRCLGMMGALGHHCAVGEVFGKIRLSGRLGWLIWRLIYWVKLPGIKRKIKVALSWLLNLLFPPEIVRIDTAQQGGITPLHFEKNETILKKGDRGDVLYILVKGKIAVEREGLPIATLNEGAYFGELSILTGDCRSATLTALTPVDTLAIPRHEAQTLMKYCRSFKQEINDLYQQRNLSIGDETTP
ncbi:MAG: cyclic nucleotide-binding domain-containing protein, partial [Chlamydiota bacterium]|nr:cyclic nucleotide-binding domain-containing protein [Chlamydiota bacterium]